MNMIGRPRGVTASLGGSWRSYASLKSRVALGEKALRHDEKRSRAGGGLLRDTVRAFVQPASASGIEGSWCL